MKKIQHNYWLAKYSEIRALDKLKFEIFCEKDHLEEDERAKNQLTIGFILIDDFG